MQFTSVATRYKEKKEITIDYIGGQYKNYFDTYFDPTSVVYVKQSGQNIPYTLETINGKLRICIGSLRGQYLISYNYQDSTEPYAQVLDATIYNPTGTPNNYFTVSKYPVIDVHSHSFLRIEGISRQNVILGSLTGRIELEYDYDSGERGLITAGNLNTELQNIQNEASITSLYTAKTNSQIQKDLNYKMNNYYSLGFEIIKNFSREKAYYKQEDSTKGTWTLTPNPSGENTYFYLNGDSASFFDSINNVNIYNYNNLNALTSAFIKKEELVPTTVYTYTTTPSGGANGKTTLDINSTYFETDTINPLILYVTLPEAKYITKISIKSCPDYDLQKLISVQLSNSIASSGIELLSKEIETSKEYIDINCVQKFKDLNGISLKDENDQEYIYLEKKQVVKIVIGRELANNVFFQNIQIYAANVTDAQSALYDNYNIIRDYNSSFSTIQYGPNNGWDTYPPVGRATWLPARLTTTITASGGNLARESLLSAVEEENTIDTDQLKTETNSDVTKINSQRKIWRTKFDETYQQQIGYLSSINNLSVTITKNKINQANVSGKI